MLAEWNKLKPVQGTSSPRDSVATLRAFEERFKKMRDDLANVTKAKTALEMSEALGLPGGDQNKIRLDNSMEELQDLLGGDFVRIRRRCTHQSSPFRALQAFGKHSHLSTRLWTRRRRSSGRRSSHEKSAPSSTSD
jgi:hypothetical protein